MVKLGEALVKVLTQINALENKLAKLEKNLAVSGVEYGAFGNSRSANTSPIHSPLIEKENVKDDIKKEVKEEKINKKDEADKSALIAEIQEAQRRKVEEDPEKRHALQEQRKAKEDLLKASIMKAQGIVSPTTDPTDGTSDDFEEEDPVEEKDPVEKKDPVEDRF